MPTKRLTSSPDRGKVRKRQEKEFEEEFGTDDGGNESENEVVAVVIENTDNNSINNNNELGHIYDECNKAKVLEKRKNAKKHFNYYLQRHTNMSKKSIDDLDHSEITHDLIGKYGTYMAKHARCKCNENNELLSYPTCSGYMGSIKAFFFQKFRENDVPIPFKADHWKGIMRALLTEKVSQAISEKKKLFGSKELATSQDINALAAVCYWNGDLTSAEFLNLFNAMIGNAGRGSEVSIKVV
jgi:hypothetical protein